MREKNLPSGRVQRLWQLGRLAGGVAVGAVGAGLRQRGRGEGVAQLLLTPDNLVRIRDRLSEMRGAAMKVGQLLSMESGELLPAELTALFDQLREEAHFLPLGEVARELDLAWGKGWDRDFRQFNFTPVAAASIGQVHQATTRDGRNLALKLQYPGVRKSIDSDIDNVAMLLRWSGLLPAGLDVGPLMAEAKEQLHRETDYLAEAGMLQRFAALLENDERVRVPGVATDYCAENVLAMDYLQGEPIEVLLEQPRGERNRVAGVLLELALREVFEWRLVQTDPNFANFRYDRAQRSVHLLDFGATREYSEARQSGLLQLLQAGLCQDRGALLEAAVQVGYLHPGAPAAHADGVAELLLAALEPLAQQEYDFAGSDLAKRMSERVIRLRSEEQFMLLPPPDVLFLHRKLAGLYLLFHRLRATLPVRHLAEAVLETAIPAAQDAV